MASGDLGAKTVHRELTWDLEGPPGIKCLKGASVSFSVMMSRILSTKTHSLRGYINWFLLRIRETLFD
jgi:hypothetical protein